MKRLINIAIVVIIVSVNVMVTYAQSDTLTLKDVLSSKFSPKYVGGIRPMAGASTFSRISQDKKRIEAYNYKDGKLYKVLFDKEKANVSPSTLNLKPATLDFDNYSISPDGSKILLRTDCRQVYRRSNKARYYVYDSKTNTVSLLSESNEVQNPVWSNDGTKIAFVLTNNIYIKRLEVRDERLEQVTMDGKKNSVINGIPDWVYEEEFSTANSMCFTADDKSLCWLKYDESKVPVYSLQVFDDGKNIRSPYTETKDGFYSYKYPQPGETNSTVTAWTYNLQSGKTQQFNLPLDKDGYIPRLLPIPHSSQHSALSSQLLFVTLNRHQDSLCIYQGNPADASCKLILNRKGDRYFKEMVITDMRIENGCILLPNDLGENVSVDVLGLNGQLLRNVSVKGHDITAVYGCDKKGHVYFQVAYPTPLDRSIFRDETRNLKQETRNLNPETRNLTKKTGYNTAAFSGDYNYFVHVWSDAETPYVYSIADNNGHDIKILEDNKALRDTLAKYNLPKKEFFSFTTEDGITLNGWRIKPSETRSQKPETRNQKPETDKRIPVIMHQYSGPGSQQVLNAWSIGSMGNGALYDQYLAQRGFMVVTVDGRGTGARGTAFEKCTYLKIGQTECHDQIETARWLAKQPDVDPQHIGIWGWSFGGFNTLMCLTSDENQSQNENPLFACGVAIAPPTSWRYYDSVYTERYMRTPHENAAGYDVCPLSRAKNLRGKLLIMHGLADDNVHPQNTLEFSEALVQANKDFRQQLYTNRNHSIRGGNTRHHLLRQVTNWFEKNLK